MNYTYILRCSDNTYYTGWTNDISRRVGMHNAGVASKYTRVRLPVEIAYVELFETKSEAMKREYAIKKMARKSKNQLVASITEEELNRRIGQNCNK